MTRTQDIAQFAKNFGLSVGPEELANRAKATFLDSLGVMMAGLREEVSALIARWVRGQGAVGHSTVLVEDHFRTSAANAALANGVGAHSMDFDHLGHQSAVIVPCVLALAESLKAQGRSVLEAYIVGVEVSAFLETALAHEAKALQLHSSSICGSLGAAAAAARLL